MKTSKLRQLFLDFFKEKNHKIMPSSSLVPHDDPTLLFTNAGMVQFKDTFLGKQDLGFVRAVSTQKCVRAGGKHNDLENVGFTARHHTFFEMLGNFSFGDYFKKEAIQYGFEFVTKVLKIPQEKLWITVFEQDHEAEEIWLNEIGIDPKRLSRCGEKDNFWAMGDTGPCGPCSEIFYDHGEEVEGGPPGSENEDGDRYVEIWNIVFMQYNRDKSGTLTPIPKPSVDTGMGLERIAAVMQGVHSNYDTDLFKTIIDATSKVINIKVTNNNKQSFNVIADHLRSCAFLVADGVLPSNDGRGYVLRRIMRRAIRHGKKLGATKPFFNKLVDVLVAEMGEVFPELVEACDHIANVFLNEEQQFGRTLEQGLKILDQTLSELLANKSFASDASSATNANASASTNSSEISSIKSNNIIPGDIAFKLYDTFGFPLDLTQTIAQENNFTVDMEGFEKEMLKQRERAKNASKFEHELNEKIVCQSTTTFTGYDSLESKAKIIEMFVGSEQAKEITAGESAFIVLDRTPFYAEKGGQIGDRGLIESPDGKNVFLVEDTIANKNSHAHYGKVIQGSFLLNEFVNAKVDKKLRDAIIRNHSATHLLQAALKEVLGEHVVQKGSNVTSENLRFDFSHNAQLSKEEIEKVEHIVNEKIRDNSEIKTEILPIKLAKEKGAVALFGEKYDPEVRVLSMNNDFSVELCGGTHAKSTGEIGIFKIISQSAVSAGVRRIEAETGIGALGSIQSDSDLIDELTFMLKTSKPKIKDKLVQLEMRLREKDKEIKKLQNALTSSKGGKDFADEVKEIKGIKVLVQKIDHIDNKGLREAIDKFKNKLKTAVIVFATVDEENNKVSIAAGVTKDIAKDIPAGQIVNHVASQVGGKGGGRPDFAMAGGTESQNLQKALDSVFALVKKVM